MSTETGNGKKVFTIVINAVVGLLVLGTTFTLGSVVDLRTGQAVLESRVDYSEIGISRQLTRIQLRLDRIDDRLNTLSGDNQ